MRRYIDKNGGLEVQKTDPVKNTDVKESSMLRSAPVNKDVKISATDVLETFESYQLPMFTSNKSGESKCLICGAPTSYQNRHVCVDCWKKYHNEFMEKIKESVNDIEIQIG